MGLAFVAHSAPLVGADRLRKLSRALACLGQWPQGIFHFRLAETAGLGVDPQLFQHRWLRQQLPGLGIFVPEELYQPLCLIALCPAHDQSCRGLAARLDQRNKDRGGCGHTAVSPSSRMESPSGAMLRKPLSR